MFTPEGLDDFAKSLARLNNLPLETAGLYAALIGDTPEIVEDGLVVVRGDSGEILARVRMRSLPRAVKRAIARGGR